jgi:hypothetical protein
LDAEILYQ